MRPISISLAKDSKNLGEKSERNWGDASYEEITVLVDRYWVNSIE